jgi:hypothetical protein
MLTRSADATDTLTDTQVSVTLSPVTNPVLPVETAAFTVTLYTAATATATGARRTEQGETLGVSIAHGVSVLRSAVAGPSDSVAVAGQSKEWLVEGVGMATDDQVSTKCIQLQSTCRACSYNLIVATLSTQTNKSHVLTAGVLNIVVYVL